MFTLVPVTSEQTAEFPAGWVPYLPALLLLIKICSHLNLVSVFVLEASLAGR